MNGWEDSGSRRSKCMAERARCLFGGKVEMFIQQCIVKEMTMSFSMSLKTKRLVSDESAEDKDERLTYPSSQAQPRMRAPSA